MRTTATTNNLLNTSVPCRVLVVDDEWSIRQVLHDFMSMEDWEVTLAPSGEEALKLLHKGSFDVVVTDLKMGDVDGIAVLEAARTCDPHMGVIVMTGFGTVESAIEAMKKGAFDYLLKPFKVPDLIRIVHRALERRKLQTENVKLKEIVEIYHASEAMSTTLSLDEVLDLLVRATRETTGCDALTLVTRNLSVRSGFDDASARERSAPSMSAVRTWARDGLETPCATLLESLDVDALELWLEGCGGNGGLLHGAKAWRCFAEPDTAEATGLHDMMVLPLRGRGGVWGLLTAFMFTPSHRFSDERRRLLGVLADRGAAALENAQLYGDLKETLRQTIQGLAQIIESKDPYTRGHSERVRLYAGLLAEAVGYGPKDVERIREAALLHDIGKISIRLEDLNKPGPLSPSEYEMFKSHTTRGKWLLEPIVFLHPL
ncbi:MAG: response regulator, partial [Myxococcota bacterium]